jgi:hypothetical protein
MSGHEEQEVIKEGLQFEATEREFLRNLLEGASILPLGAECCHLEECDNLAGFP